MGKKMNVYETILPIKHIEKHIQSKTGKQEDCEDYIHISKYFIAVIDGATAKTRKKWNNKTVGQVAVKTIDKAFYKMQYDYTARQAVDLMTSMIHDLYKKFDVVDIVLEDPKKRITSSFVAISQFRKEVWLVGDCQFILGNQKFSNPKLLDQILSSVRALYLELEIQKGATFEQLQQNDTGRKFIMPLLKEQSRFQNNERAEEYWYPVVDGFHIPTNGIIIKKIPNHIKKIILATDGYPDLKDSYNKSEKELNKILTEDPLLFKKYKSTKGLVKGYVSFDDRAFIEVKFER